MEFASSKVGSARFAVIIEQSSETAVAEREEQAELSSLLKRKIGKIGFVMVVCEVKYAGARVPVIQSAMSDVEEIELIVVWSRRFMRFLPRK